MDGKSKLIRYICIVISILAIVQSLLWIALAILHLLIYNNVIVWDITVDSYNEAFYYVLYNQYLEGKHNTLLEINASTLIVFSIFYLILSIEWFIVSSHFLWVIIHQKLRHLKIILLLWSGIAIIISVIDLVLYVYLINDYSTLNNFVNLDMIVSNFLYLLYLNICFLLNIIAIRGYFLWLFNVICALTFVIVSFRYWKELQNMPEMEVNQNRMPIINAYQSDISENPWSNMQRNSTVIPGASNPAFESSPFTRSHSFSHNDLEHRNHNRGRSSSVAGDYPYIPTPDYTPPNSPVFRRPLKPALRQKSNYQY